MTLPEGWPHTSQGKRPRRPWTRWDDDRKRKFTELWLEGASLDEISDECTIAPGNISATAARFGLPGRSGRKRRFPTDRTNQRRHPGNVSVYGPRVDLAPHHPALRIGTTLFPMSVVPAGQVERLLKSGENSRKIGKRVTKGRWKDQPIFTLTLVERETCPRSCLEWATCYGNNMHNPERILDDGLLTKLLWAELAKLQSRFPAGFVVRLHVLGDFYSRDYVRFWREALSDFPALNIFGFTARLPKDPIGADLVRLVADQGERFVIRFSGGGHESHCSEVVAAPADVKHVRCPAETDENRCCASCALCWQSDRTISFVRH